MRTFNIRGPNGRGYSINADSIAALTGALAELFPEMIPHNSPNHAAEAVDLLKELVAKEHPPFPEIPAAEAIDLSPVVDALRRLEAKDAPATDVKPLADKLDLLAGLITRLANTISKANAANEERQTAVVEAIDRLHQIMAAPRKLVRENGRPVASVVDFNGEFSGG